MATGPPVTGGDEVPGIIGNLHIALHVELHGKVRVKPSSPSSAEVRSRDDGWSEYYAAKLQPTSIDFSKPGVATAMEKFQRYAATKVHTGRFSAEILHKMGNMLKAGMHPGQFVGGLNSIDEVMNRYSKEDQLVTVADYKQMQQAPASLSQTPQLSNLSCESPDRSAN
jgi:hypothetical protein